MTDDLLKGDCLELLPALPDNSIDAIVTDPPYELGFMGKAWDNSGIAYNVELWSECLRVLKPGGHLLAFGGSRTYHRLACAVEDAGFEVRDQIMWLYGSGFPKSLDVSKAIDKAAGAEREVLGVGAAYCKEIEEGRDCPGHPTANRSLGGGANKHTASTAPATPDAKTWQGWGTALKPAHEPIVVARKPLIGTVANNVLTHGTGALNIDGCRVGSEARVNPPRSRKEDSPSLGGGWTATTGTTAEGRWPANVIHDGSDEVLAGFPDTKGSRGLNRRGATTGTSIGGSGRYGTASPQEVVSGFDDEGSAARFFYCAKASKAERNAGLEALEALEALGVGALRDNGRTSQPRQNIHPTVKPLALMRYLVRLVTPPGGVVLDPFLGSGTTAVAAVLEGFEWTGCEMTEEYWPIIEARVEWAEQEKAKPTPAPKAKRSAPKKKTSGGQQTLFAE